MAKFFQIITAFLFCALGALETSLASGICWDVQGEKEQTDCLKSAASQGNEEAISAIGKMVATYASRANSLYQGEMYLAARDDFDHALILKPEDATLLAGRGRSNLAMGDLNAAYNDYGAALEIDPLNITALFDMALISEQWGEAKKAVSGYRKVIEIDPGYLDPYVRLGQVLVRESYFEEAVQTMKAAVARFPDEADTYYWLGVALRGLDSNSLALEAFNTAFELSPSATILYQIAHSHHAEEQFDEEIAAYTKALEMEPGFVVALNDRGLVWLRQKEYAKAIADFDAAIAQQPVFPAAYCNRGQTYAKLGEHQRAVADFTLAIALAPSTYCAYLNRAESNFLLSQYEVAIADLDVVIGRYPDDAYAHYLRGRSFLQLTYRMQTDADTELRQRAIEDLQQAFALDPTLEDAAKILEALGRPTINQPRAGAAI